jgi:hypothetical protein
MAAPLISPPLQKNQRHTIPFDGSLTPSDGKVRFYLSDAFSRFWQADGLPRGAYYLGFVYENDKQASDGGPPLWSGRAETLLETVVIK